MTQQLIEIIERVKSWPEWRQDDAAYLLEMMEESGTRLYRLSDEERSDLIRDNTRKLYMALTRAGQRVVMTYAGLLPETLRNLPGMAASG